MNIKDKIGLTVTNWLMPYITDDFKKRGDNMKNSLDYDNYCLKEKYLWFLGKEDFLTDFYMTETSPYITYNHRETYYYKTDNEVRKIHSGIPSLISYSKLRLLNNGEITRSVIRKNGNEDTAKTEMLNKILKDNSFNKIIKKSILTESWGGRFAWKISYDSTLTDYPILEMYNPMEYKAYYKCNRLQKIVFYNKIRKEKALYELEEIFGLGYIDYKLYIVKGNGDKKQVELSYIEETADLKRVDFTNKKLIMAGEKSNEKSDYDGIISEFDALDEAHSQLLDEIRLGRSEVYVPEILLTNKTFNKFRKNFAVIGADMKENGKNEINHVQSDIRSDEYGKTINMLLQNILINVGLSPFTVGIQDGIGANSSGDSLTKREATSLRTRDEMITEWQSFLIETFQKLLIANDIFNKKAVQDYEVEVYFDDYITPSRDEIITQTKELIDSNIIDVEKALDEIFGNMLSEEEKTRILANTGNVTFEEEIAQVDVDEEIEE